MAGISDSNPTGDNWAQIATTGFYYHAYCYGNVVYALTDAGVQRTVLGNISQTNIDLYLHEMKSTSYK